MRARETKISVDNNEFSGVFWGGFGVNFAIFFNRTRTSFFLKEIRTRTYIRL